MKPRKCGICRQPATYGNAVNAWCSHEHGLELAKRMKSRSDKRKAAADRKAQRDARERVKTGPTLRKEAQAAFNAWVRMRDAGKPCVSCGRPDDGHHQRHAGHYRSVGGYPALRFEPDNVHAQCATCNNYLSGNLVGYRAELVRRIGLPRVEWLEGPHEPAKLSRDELVSMTKCFRELTRELSRGISKMQDVQAFSKDHL